MNISSTVFAILCCLLPYCTVIAIVAVIGTRGKYKSAIRILKDLEQNSQNSTDKPLLSDAIKIYILIVCAFLGLIVVSLTLVAIFYFNPSTVLKMDTMILWFIVPIFMIAGILTSIILIVIFRKIFLK